MKTETTQSQIINVSIEIGGIAECRWHYTDGLAQVIDASGKNLHEMTIGELLDIDRQYQDRLNKTAKQLISKRFYSTLHKLQL